MKEEKDKLNKVYIFFAYINKADYSLKDQQFELAIRLINTATEKFLKQFPINSAVFKRGTELINQLKNKITNIIEEKLTKWLVEINKEQSIIGETLYKKMKAEQERQISVKNEFFVYSDNSSSGVKESKLGKSNIRATRNIVDNLLLIRNTSNLNYMINKNSLLKSSVLNQADIVEEFDIINMVSNIDLNFLEQAYSIYKKVDYDTKFIEHFRNFRQSQIQSLIKLNSNILNNNHSYDCYFSDVLGFIMIQIAVYELLPIFYSKRQFEEIMNYLIKELQSNLSYEFDNLKDHNDYINLEKSIFVFISSIERIGISERVGIDIKSLLFETMRDKIKFLNFILIRKYNNLFVNLLYDEKCVNIEVHNQDEFLKYATQYMITLDDNSKPISGFIYPFKLPYTIFVIEVNENFKNYVDEIFEFVRPIFTEYDSIMPEVVKDFLKKINEVFITFSNNQEQDLNIILAAQICNNIRFILKSHNFYSNYVMNVCNIKNYISFDSERSLKESWQVYEEIIYENLKNKLRQFVSDLSGENWLPDRPNTKANSYVEGMITYLSTIYVSIQTLSPYYIESCFKDAIKFISKIYLEILFNSHVVKSYNIYAIENLKLDVEMLDGYFNNISLTHPGFNECLIPINQILSIFSNKKIDQFVEKNKNVEAFYEIKLDDLCKFLGRYKNLKKANEIKGKITENDINSLIKKLKELNNKNDK